MRGLDKIGGLVIVVLLVYLVVQFFTTERRQHLPGFAEVTAPQTVVTSFERAFPGAEIETVAKISPIPPDTIDRFRVTYIGRDAIERQALIRQDGEIVAVNEIASDGTRPERPKPEIGRPATSPNPKVTGKWED